MIYSKCNDKERQVRGGTYILLVPQFEMGLHYSYDTVWKPAQTSWYQVLSTLAEYLSIQKQHR